MATLTMLQKNASSGSARGMAGYEPLENTEDLVKFLKHKANVPRGGPGDKNKPVPKSVAKPKKAPNGTVMTRKRSSSTSSSSSSLTTLPSRSQYALVLALTPLNNTFEKKTLIVPFAPEVLKLGRQTNQRTAPAPDNGFFDSRVLSRQHAELWADRATNKVWIKDAKSSNGTYINGRRLSNDNQESEPHELKKNDLLELGIDITNDEGTSLLHRKISAKVEMISMMSLMSSSSKKGIGIGELGLKEEAPRPDSLDVALFGDVDATLEDLALVHASNSMSGIYMNSGVSNMIAFESTVRRLINEIQLAKQEGAKMTSVARLLEKVNASQTKTTVLETLAEKLEAKEAQVQSLEHRLQQREDELARLRQEFHSLQEAAQAAPSSPSLSSAPVSGKSVSGSNGSPSLSRDASSSFSNGGHDEDEWRRREKLIHGVEPPKSSHEGDISREDILSSASSLLKSHNPEADKRLQTVLSELAETKCKLELYRNRALAAEDIAMKSSKTIAELVQALEERQETASLGASALEPASPSLDSLNKDATSAVAADDQALGAGRAVTASLGSGVRAIPVSSAVGVVIIGIGIMTVINSFARDR
ncbi:hypothetical protein TRVA0_001S05776 [Trichomonascus vanleenenianus]|uniref:uncharacterized protein n=1 Tax=Trichomonascus vanleenenianus TaxID=2268995 RepID=UPI003ECA42F9